MKDTYLSLPSGGGKITDIESTGIESSADDPSIFRAYIKYNNGILVCYGRFSKVLNNHPVEFLAQFVNVRYMLTVSRYNNTDKANTSNSAIWVSERSITNFKISGDDTADDPYGIWGDYIAIGWWK